MNMFLIQCLQIMFGNMGVLDGISKGKCYVEMSTVDEETVQDVADVSPSTFCISAVYQGQMILL